MKSFAKLVNSWKPSAINRNSSIIDAYQGYECATESTTKEEVTSVYISLML